MHFSRSAATLDLHAAMATQPDIYISNSIFDRISAAVDLIGATAKIYSRNVIVPILQG